MACWAGRMENHVREERYVKIWFSKGGERTVGLVFAESYLTGKSVKKVAKTWPKFYAPQIGQVHTSLWYKSWVDAWMHDENKKV